MLEAEKDSLAHSQIYVHLPYIRLADPALEIEYESGLLRSLDYAEWEPLDQEAAHSVRFAFERTRPVFFVREASPSHDHETARREMHSLYLALVFLTGAHIPEPSKSISYMKTGRSIFRHVGIFDRAAVLHGPTRLLIDAATIEHAATLVPLIRECSEVLEAPEFRQILRTLTSTATDDFHALDGIVSCVIALEGLLLKNVLSGITAKFIKRTCNLIMASEKDPATLQANIETLYSLRSDALHGRDWKQSLSQTSKTDAQWFDYATQVLCRAALATLTSLKNRKDVGVALDELRTILD